MLVPVRVQVKDTLESVNVPNVFAAGDVIHQVGGDELGQRSREECKTDETNPGRGRDPPGGRTNVRLKRGDVMNSMRGDVICQKCREESTVDETNQGKDEIQYMTRKEER